MNVCQITKAMSAYTVIGLVLATATAAMPFPARATDIAWHAESMTTYNVWPNTERKGTVALETGEKASFVSKSTAELSDDKGMTPWKAEYVLRFDDGSAITFRSAGTFDRITEVSTGAGEFVSGTGRFEGITGKLTQVSRFSSSMVGTDFVGSYSLPNR
jgi:hypothetical protein